MSEANNIEKPDGQDPVSENTGGQQSESEKSKSGDRLFTRDRVDIFALLVALIALVVMVIGIQIATLISVFSQIDTIRAENASIRAESRAEYHSLAETLRAEIRAGFTSIDNRVISNDERIDNLYSREIGLNGESDDEEEEEQESEG